MSPVAETLTRLRRFNAWVERSDPKLAEETADLAATEVLDLIAPPERAEEAIALESIILRRARPVLAIRDNDTLLEFIDQADSEIWVERLARAKPVLDHAIRAVGRIGLAGGRLEWVGAGWLVAPTIMVTNRHVAEEFTERNGRGFTFKVGVDGPIRATVDFLQEFDNPATLEFTLVNALHVEPQPGPDFAFFEVDLRGGNAALALPIALASRQVETENAATIGYPAYDSRIPDSGLMERIFGHRYNKKRLAPGAVTRVEETHILHNCTTLGGNSGSAVIDLDSGAALGLHFSGSFLATNYAVRADIVKQRLDDLRGAGIRLEAKPWRVPTRILRVAPRIAAPEPNTRESGTVSTPATESADATVQPFDSLSALRREHVLLMRAMQSPGNATDAMEKSDGIDLFLSRAEASGSYLDDQPERDAAQSILDYWRATIVTLLDPKRPSARARSLAPFDETRAPDLSGRPSPFKGLHAFGNDDADRFFGRSHSVNALTEKVTTNRLVLVTGPSGSGKSSLVYAGLVVRLKEGAIPGSKEWRYLPPVMPGSDPLAALLLAVRPEGADPQSWVAEHKPRLQKSALHLRQLAEAGTEPSPVLLIVDQFEELFTLGTDAAARQQFAEAVVKLSESPTVQHRVVLTIREGFLKDAWKLTALAPFASEPICLFVPVVLSPSELREVVEKPAALAGLKFDEGIVADLVKEVVGEPTALPLLQFTLLKLWQSRKRNRITWETYRTVGKPREALQRTAEATFADLRLEENQQTAKRIFVELVQPSVGAEFVRRRVRRESLMSLEAAERVNHVLERFVAADLIRMTPGVGTDDDRFEVVHEALIRNWPRLSGWLKEKRELLGRQLQYENTARLWRDSGRQSPYLLSGETLKDAAQYAVTVPLVGELVAASGKAQRGRSRKLWAIAAVALVVTVGLWLRAELKHRRAERELSTAMEALDLAGRQIATAQHAQSGAEAATRRAESARDAAIATLTEVMRGNAKGLPPNGKTVSQAIERIATEPISASKSFWTPGSTLRVRFLNGSPELQKIVEQNAREWARYANVSFDFGSSQKDAEIRIDLNDRASWSFLGTQARTIPNDRPTMTLGVIQDLDNARARRAVLHEFGHALGLVHEHQQPGAKIPWNVNVVMNDFAKRLGFAGEQARDVLHTYSASIGYSHPFDPKSIMNYFEIPAAWTNGKVEVKALPLELSEGDKTLIRQLYPARP